MAAIGITVNNDEVTISLDAYEWTGLTVNGNTINPSGSGFSATVPLPAYFTATANGIDPINPSTILTLKGNNGTDYACTLVYTDQSNPFNIYGSVFSTSDLKGASNGPLAFSQGMMTGVFSLAD